MLKYITALLLIIAHTSVIAQPSKENIQKKLELDNVSEINKTGINKLYEVITTDYKIFYITEDLKYAINGELIDIDKKESITRSRALSLRPADQSNIISNKVLSEIETLSVIEKKGTALRKLYIVTNPDCPYCKKLEMELKGLTDVTIYRLVLANENNMEKVKNILCAENKTSAWMHVIENNQIEQSTCDNYLDTVQKSLAVAKSLKIKGTPTLFNSRGQKLTGFKPLSELETFLSK